ncbi:MFS transporter [Rhodobacteraceae bacterium RKSG542]|uniref:MFS transporter n=1 Tax=Pseudovibrio flavus TaxID=2529854 RepID=UPI0012BC377C|nr:MFS transporter [Pseudovibrio flavus]MTI15713.1 MFS transporter [Pseudovibrio flavus]
MLKDRAVLILAIGETLVWASFYYAFPALVLRWERELGWSKVDITLAFTSAIFIAAAASPLAGRLIDKGKGPQLIAFSALLGAGGLFYLASAETLWQFYIAWAVIGLAQAGCLYEPCFALLTRARGIDAKKGIIVLTLISGFASTISYPATHLLSEAMSWRHAMIVAGFTVAFIAAPALWLGASLLEQGAQQRSIQTAGTQNEDRAFLRAPVFWLLALCFSFGALAHATAINHILPMLDSFKVDLDLAVILVSLMGPLQVSGRIVVMSFERRLSMKAVALLAYCAIAASFMLLLYSKGSLILIGLFFIVFCGFYGTISIVRPIVTREILGERNFGAKMGALALPFLAGGAIAPYFGAQIWSFGGYGLVLMVLVAVAIIGIAAFAAAGHLANRTERNRLQARQ